MIDEVVRLAVQCVLIVLYLPPSSRPFALIVCATLGKSREPNEIAGEGKGKGEGGVVAAAVKIAL